MDKYEFEYQDLSTYNFKRSFGKFELSILRKKERNEYHDFWIKDNSTSKALLIETLITEVSI